MIDPSMQVIPFLLPILACIKIPADKIKSLFPLIEHLVLFRNVTISKELQMTIDVDFKGVRFSICMCIRGSDSCVALQQSSHSGTGAGGGWHCSIHLLQGALRHCDASASPPQTFHMHTYIPSVTQHIYTQTYRHPDTTSKPFPTTAFKPYPLKWPIVLLAPKCKFNNFISVYPDTWNSLWVFYWGLTHWSVGVGRFIYDHPSVGHTNTRSLNAVTEGGNWPSILAAWVCLRFCFEIKGFSHSSGPGVRGHRVHHASCVQV